MVEEAPTADGQGVSPESAGQAKWYDGAPDEVKGYVMNKGWDSPLKTVEAYQNLEKFHGVPADQLLKLPKDFNADGALDPIYDRLGRPKSVDEYKVELPDGVNVDESRLKSARELAHKLGLNAKQFSELAKFDAEYYQNISSEYNKNTAAKQEAEYNQLISEWGSNAAEREELARRGMKMVVPKDVNAEEFISKIEDAIGTAATLKMFANLGEKVAREDRIHDSGTDRPFGYTREQAKSDKEILMNEMKSDPTRLALYNQGQGNDYEKMKRLNSFIVG